MLGHSTCIFRRNRFSTIQQRSSSSKSGINSFKWNTHRNNKSYMEIVNNNQYSQDNYVSTNQNNKDALWLAPITVNGIGVYALIDSGAQRTIMTQKLLRELQAKGARFKEYHENGNLMQTDSPLKIVTS